MQSLEVSIGSQTTAGIKSINEDSVGFCIPDLPKELDHKGVCCALADGVSSAEAGKAASQLAVQQFVDDYFETPDTWSASHAGQKMLSAINLSLFKKSHQFNNQEKGFLCTFEGLIIKSQTAHFFHVGDSRLFHLRNKEMKQLTRDHCAAINESKSYLTRALGMDNNLHVDYGKVTVEQGDYFLLTTDGIHDFISNQEIVETVYNDTTEQQKCENLVTQSLAKGSDDNISCVLIQVKQVPQQSLNDLNTKLTRLAFPPLLEPGMKLDGYLVEKQLFASSRSQLYQVKDIACGIQLVMKTPSINFVDDVAYIDRFIQEEWIGKRIKNKHVVNIVSQKTERTCLYYLMELVDGISLDKWIEANPFPSPKRAIGIIKQITNGLTAFHEKETIHQDLKPGNILIDKNDQVKLVDFGSTFVAGTAELFSPLQHEGALGTATYSDPNYLLGKNTGIQGDLYSLATICYEVFTGKLPYTDRVEECQTHHEYDQLRYQSATNHNPVIPIWFDRALEKGCKISLENRYNTIEQFIDDLTQPNPDFLLDVPEAKAQQSKTIFWSLLSGFWILMFVAVISMFSRG